MQNKKAVAGIEPDSKIPRWLNSLPTYHYTTKATEPMKFCRILCAWKDSLGSISDILISYKKGTILYREKRGLKGRAHNKTGMLKFHE